MTESVWDYPRPPRVEPATRRVRVVLGGETVADSTRAYRVLETSHPPVYYIPLADVAPGVLTPSPGRETVCEWKGAACYFDVSGGRATAPRGAWAYRHPSPGYGELRDTVAFYPSLMDDCFLDAEPVRAQAGDFYGGWITDDIAGPFKGGVGTAGW